MQHSLPYARWHPDVPAGHKVREYLRCEVIPNLQGKATNAKVGVNRKIFYKTENAESFWQDLLPSDERLAKTQEAANLRNETLQEAIAINADFNGPMKERHKIETAFKKTKKMVFEESIKDGFVAPEKARGLLKIVKQQFDLSVDRRGHGMLVIFVILIVPPLLPPLSPPGHGCEQRSEYLTGQGWVRFAGRLCVSANVAGKGCVAVADRSCTWGCVRCSQPGLCVCD